MQALHASSYIHAQLDGYRVTYWEVTLHPDGTTTRDCLSVADLDSRLEVLPMYSDRDALMHAAVA